MCWLLIARKDDAAHLLIEIATPDGKLAGLNSDSLFSLINLSVLSPNSIRGKIGELSPQLMQQMNACLKQALEL